MLDDDFFELDEDLLNASDFSKKCNEISEEEVCQNVRFLNCTGDDQLTRQTFHEHSFIANDEIKLIASNLKKFHNHKLFDSEFSEDVLTDSTVLQSLLDKTRMNVQTLLMSSRENSSFVTKKSYFTLRQQTTTFLFQLRHLLFTGRIKYNVVEDLLRPFAPYLEQLNALPIVDVLHTIHSTLGNDSTSPAYHLLHGHMEWRWIYITIYLRIEQDKLNQNLMITENTLRNTEFEEKLQLFMYDLILLSAAKFNKLQTNILVVPSKSPFTCSCVKEMWLLIQLLIERLHENDGQLNSFWHYFDLMLNLHRERKSPYDAMKQSCVARDTTAVFANDPTIFSLWLLNGVATLHGYSEDGIYASDCTRVRENAELLESLLKALVLAEPSEQHLRASLLIVNPLLTTWWTRKPELLMIFWEYFHKKLNSSFYVNGATPAGLAVIGKTASEYLQQIEKLIYSENITTDMSSYMIFINLLGKILKRLVQLDTKNHTMKIIGRIFTKFGESKLNALTEVGIHNVLTLFLILASIVGVKEIGQRLSTILLQIRLEKLPAPRQSCLVKGHMALLILYSHQDVNTQNYVSRLLEQINKLNSDENKLPVLRIMIEALERICQKSDVFSNDEYMILDSWIFDFLSYCSQSEQERCLQFVNQFFVNIVKDVNLKQQYPEQHRKVIQTLYKYVLPFVKQIYRQSNVFGGVPDIAATFTLNANGQDGLANFQDLFKHFTEATCCDIQTTTKFLINILTNENLEKFEQIVIIRLWLKCCTLSSSPNNEDIRQLTRIILTLPDFSLLCKTTESEILGAKEPLSIFFASCGKLYETASDQGQKQIAEYLQSALLGFEKWVPMSESPPAIFKIHIVIALIIFNCSSIVYVRSKPSCFFSVIMNHYILPLPLLTGKEQKLISIQAVHKVWHLIVGGIEKLDYQSDAQLQKVFTDLIVKWIPQFRLIPMQKIASKPFVTCAHHSKPSTLQFILDKMINNFLSAQRRETHQNAPIVVTILTDILAEAETDTVRVLLNTTILSLFEHAMMVDEKLPSRTMVFDFFSALFKTPAYITSCDIRAIVTSNLKTLTTKNLSYYASFFFQFMQKLARINSKCVLEVLPHIKEQVKYVEELRNAGTDARLRTLLKQLEEIVQKI